MTASLAILHSGCPRSEEMTKPIIDGINSESVAVKRFSVAQARNNLDELDSYDGLIFGSSTETDVAYAEMKAFIEAAAEKSHLGSWRDKIAAAFVNSPSLSREELSALIQYSIFSAQHNMVWISSGLSSDPTLLSGSEAFSSNTQPELTAFPIKDVGSPQRVDAYMFGRRVAQVAKSWCLQH